MSTRPERHGGRCDRSKERDDMAHPNSFDRLTASDLFLMLWDDYGWATDIGALAVLDGTTLLEADGRVRIEQIRRQLEPRLVIVPRFRQLLYRPRTGLGWPLWVDAPAFDIADHIRVHDVATPGDEGQLLRACEDGSIRPARSGRCGCFPGWRMDASARWCGCTTRWRTARRPWPPSGP
jgi:hypothetical protein